MLILKEEMKNKLAQGFRNVKGFTRVNQNSKGFTLVELLIVIGLLAAIALIVIAAINPIEQANRARDTRFKADGGQLLSAIERYFAARSVFPWVTVEEAEDNDASYGFTSASSIGVGVCGDSSCTEDGELMTSLELKSEFQGRDFIQKGEGTDNTQKIFIGKATGSSSSVYACFVPMSKSNRDAACLGDKVYTVSASDGERSSVSCDAGDEWVVSGTPWVVCVPE